MHHGCVPRTLGRLDHDREGAGAGFTAQSARVAFLALAVGARPWGTRVDAMLPSPRTRSELTELAHRLILRAVDNPSRRHGWSRPEPGPWSSAALLVGCAGSAHCFHPLTGCRSMQRNRRRRAGRVPGGRATPASPLSSPERILTGVAADRRKDRPGRDAAAQVPALVPLPSPGSWPRRGSSVARLSSLVASLPPGRISHFLLKQCIKICG